MGLPELYLIDGSSYVYRAFYAMRNLTTSKGIPTNAVYILARMLLKLLKEQSSDHICFILDPPGPTHRHEMYEKYKANRPKMPESLEIQFPYILKVVEALGIPIIQQEGIEADDIIAALTLKYRAEAKVTIISGDKDLMQFVGGNVVVWDTLKDKLYDRNAVIEKYRVAPEYIADLLAIMGDSSDNIPGVPGIGEKGAVALIQKMGHLEEIIENIEKIPAPKQKQALSENIDLARLSLELVRLDRGADIDISPEQLILGKKDESKLLDLFQELEFKALIKELQGEQHVPPRQALTGEVVYSCNPELTGSSGMYFVPGLGAAVSKDNTTYVCLDKDTCLKALSLSGVNLSLHDAKQALTIAKKCGLEIHSEIFDISLAAYCIDAASGLVTLEDLARSYLDQDIPSLKDVIGSGRNAKAYKEIPDEKKTLFLASHAQVLEPLKTRLEEKLAQFQVEKIYHEIEIPLTHVLSRMEATGVMLDKEFLANISTQMSLNIADLQEGIFDIAGREFNINSPKQLGSILFEDLGLPAVKKTKTGYSTDSNVLAALATKHELPARILDYRTLTKLKNTYIDTLPGMIDPSTGRIHTTFNQAGTATGRISSSDPNLQNIPIRTEIGRRIREAFVAPEGYQILSADYSQIELRVLAHISQDPRLMEAFIRDLDIHTQTASEIFGLPLAEVSSDQRRAAKTINFGIVYGMGPHRLSNELGIKQSVAKLYIQSYLVNYSGVKTYMEMISAQAFEAGFVTTIMGRRRTIPEINSRNFNEREGAKRIAINTPIQGSAADIIKIAMIRIHEKIKSMRSRMILQVHDELVFEAADKEVEELQMIVKQEMEGAFALDIPLKVDMGIGNNWSEAH